MCKTFSPSGVFILIYELHHTNALKMTDMLRKYELGMWNSPTFSASLLRFCLVSPQNRSFCRSQRHRSKNIEVPADYPFYRLFKNIPGLMARHKCECFASLLFVASCSIVKRTLTLSHYISTRGWKERNLHVAEFFYGLKILLASFNK